jgi:hypothetical protein
VSTWIWDTNCEISKLALGLTKPTEIRDQFEIETNLTLIVRKDLVRTAQ